LQKGLIGAGVVSGLVIVGLFVAGEAYDVATGCGSVDPTDPANYTSASIVNNTTSAVTVTDCQGSYCQAEIAGTRLLPDQRVDFRAGCHATGSDMTSWKLQRENGSTLGYIAVDTPRSMRAVVYDASSASPTRQTPTAMASGGASTR
jgi:hypothetical protein